jgi:hypothetical protein
MPPMYPTLHDSLYQTPKGAAGTMQNNARIMLMATWRSPSFHLRYSVLAEMALHSYRPGRIERALQTTSGTGWSALERPPDG